MTGALEPRSLSLFEPLTVATMPNYKEGFGRERLDEVSSNDQSESLETNAQFNYPKLEPPLHKGGELESSLNKGGEKELQNPTSLDVPQQLSNQHENIPAPSTPQPAISITSDPNVETRKFPSLTSPVQLPNIPTQLVLPQPLIGEEQEIFGSRNVSVASALAKGNHDVSSDVAASMLRPSEISATTSNSLTEQQSIPQHKPTIQQIFQQITSVPTLLNSESSPIQKTVLSASTPDSSPRITLQQTYPVQPTLTTPITSENIEVWQPQSTSKSQHKSSTLASIAQRIITEKIIAPVETSTSIRGETENNHHLSQMGETSTSQLLVVGRSLANQNNNQTFLNNNQEPTANNQQPIPTIQVNIGRIEVRATPPVVTPSQKQRFAPQVMNLDEYLGQRSKGGNR